MIEVEIKLPIYDRELLDRKLTLLRFNKGIFVKESDIYFNSESFDLKKKDMALRIRTSTKIDTGESTTKITYKGPKLDHVSMTRKELEMEVSDASTCYQILEGIGFYPLCPVHKLRQYYCKGQMTACVDQVDGLGEFLELEMIVDSESEREKALEEIERLLRILGYDKKETTRISYLSMLQKEQAK